MFTVANKKGKAQRDRSKDKQFTSFAGHNNSVGQHALQPMTLSNNTSADMNLNSVVPQQFHGNQAQNRRNQQKNELYCLPSQPMSQKGQPVRLGKNNNGSGKGQKTLNSAKETQNVSGNNSKISTPGQHLISAGGIQNQKAKSSVLDQIVQMQSQTSNLNNNATLSQQLNHQQISQRRGTTPVRPPAKTQLTQMANAATAVHGSGGLPLNPLLAANNGSSKGNARGKQQYSSTSQQKKQKIPADLQINRLMAAANAQAQANPNIQKQLKNQNLFPNQSQMPSNQLLLATLQGTEGIEAKQYATGAKQEGKRQGAESAAGYQYRSEHPHLYENLAVSDETLKNGQQNLAGTNFDLNIAAQRSHEQNWDSRAGHAVKLFDPVAEEPTPDHLAARTSSEYVNTDEEEEVEGYERSKTAEKQKAGDLFESQSNQYMQHNMHPLKNSVKSKHSNRQKSEERKSYGKQVLQNDLEVAHANQNLLLLRDQYSQVAAEKDFNGSGSQSRKKSRSQNKRTDNNLVFQTQVLQQHRDVLAAGGAQYVQNGGGTSKGAHPVKAAGARQRGQSVSHANNGRFAHPEGAGAATRSGKQSASIDRKLEVKHQKSQQAKNLKNNLSQQMNNMAKIAQETKSLKTIQYNPIGLSMCPASQQVQNQIISPQPVPSQNLIFKQQQQQMEGMQNAVGALPSDPSLQQSQPQLGMQGAGVGAQLDLVQLQQTLQQLSRVEQIQVQLSRRVDIFEEEIIKRVREIQKYSKGLNQIIRKNVIPQQEETDKKLKQMDNKVQQVNQKIEMPAKENAETDQNPAPTAANYPDPTSKLEEQQQAIFETQEQMEKLFRMFEEQNSQIQQMQEQGEVEVQEKLQEAMTQCQQLAEQHQMNTQQMNEHVTFINQIQEKLAEQNQLISIFDDQITNQEEKLENMVKSYAEISNQVNEMAQDQNNKAKPSPVKQSVDMPDIDEITQKVFESIVNCEQMQKVAEHEDLLQQVDSKMKEMEVLFMKIQEDGEGRDGLILQQNQDITNLFSANEQILGNEKTFKEHHEKLDAQLGELIAQIEEADWQNSAQVEERVQQVVQEVAREQFSKLAQDQENKQDNEQTKQQLSARSDTSSKQLEQLRVNLETRMMLSIETVKRDISMTMAQNQAQQNQSLELLQKRLEQHDLVIEKIPQDQNDLAIVQEQLQNLELQMQAQFDEWVTEQDKSLQDKFNQMNHLLQQQNKGDYVTKDLTAEMQKELEEQIAITQANIDKVVVMQQSSLNPLHAKIQDLQIEIGQKVVEMSQQQDNQISQLVEEIKQISDNLENMQEIVVQCNTDSQSFKTQTNEQFDQVLQQINHLTQTQAQAQAQAQAQTQAQAQQPQTPSVDPSQVSQLSAELKEHRHDISELSSDFTAIKIDLQKLRQMQQQERQGKDDQNDLSQKVSQIEEGIVQRVMNDLDNELNGMREEISTAVISQVEGIIEGVKQELSGITQQEIESVKKWTETALKGIKVDDVSSKVNAQVDDVSQKINAIQQGLAQNEQFVKNVEKNQKESIDKVKKQVQDLSSEIKQSQVKVDQIAEKAKQIESKDEQTSQDLLTMKNIVSYLQDSNYQAQIDSIKKELQNGAQFSNRFSLPEPMKSQAGPISQRDSVPASSQVAEEIETIVMAKKPKKAQQVRSSNPMAVKKKPPVQDEMEPEKMMAGNAVVNEVEPDSNEKDLQQQIASIPPIEEVKAKKLELSPILKDSQLASSRDGRDTERDNQLLQRIGLQSAKKSEKDAFDQKFHNVDELPLNDEMNSNSQNVIQELENKFQVGLDDMDDDLMARLKKEKSSFLPDDDDVDDVEVDLKNQVMKLPTQDIAERPSDLSLPGFINAKEDPLVLLKQQEQEDMEQYSDEFETMEKQKEIDLIIEDKTNKFVEYSASALTMSAIKLEDMSTEQLADEIIKLIDFGALVDSDIAALLTDVVDRRQ